MANISLASAVINGDLDNDAVPGNVTVALPFAGGGAFGVDEWSIPGPIRIFDFDGPVTIVLDFDDAPITANTTDPYVINSDGNLGTLFSAYTLTVDTNGVVTLTVDAADFVTNGTAEFTVGGRGDASDTVFITFICFAQGTLIDTPAGPVAVENLRTGDLVGTMDKGPKALRWVGHRTLDQSALQANPHLRPIRIAAGAFGPQNPNANLTVSPQHRILMQTPCVKLNFWLEAALAPAKGLVDNHLVTVSDQDSVTYYHLLFDRHEIINANGTWTESLFPGRQSLLALDEDARREVLELFPQLAADRDACDPAAALLTVGEARVLARRTLH